MSSYSYYQWKGSCPKNLNFNHSRWKKGLCSFEDYKFFTSWRRHGERGKLCKKWRDFSVAYSWWCHQPQLHSLVHQHPDWEFEVDESGTHEFDENMRYCSRSENMKQMVKDGNHPLQNPLVARKSSLSQGRPVIVIDPLGNVTEYYGVNVVERQLGVCKSIVSRCCNCDIGSHTSYRGKYKGWTFYWKDEYTA